MQNDKPNEKISFKPLHEGVGFHPFSEGLPYAPQSTTSKPESKPRATAHSISPSTFPSIAAELRTDYKKDYTQGTGAMSAGSPSFATPKTTRQIQQQNIQSPVANVQTAAPRKLAKTPEQTVLRKRFFAYLLDTVVHMGFWITINLIATLGFHFEIDGDLLERNLFGFVMFFAFSQWFFIAMQEMLFENSIGKSFFGLEFRRNRTSFFGSSLLVRSVIFMAGLFAFGLGLYFRPQDKIAEVQLKHS